MSEDNNPPQSPRSPRRSSFAGQALSDLFGTGRPSMSRGTTDSPPTMPTASSPPAQPVGPISRAAQQAQQRRMSLTTLGLSGSPTQSSAFANYRTRGESIGSSNATSHDESAIAEDDAPSRDGGNGGSPTNTPFQRRTSFGARALRDIRSGSLSGQPGTSPGSPGSNGTSSTPSSNDATKKNAQKYGSISSRDTKGRGLSLTSTAHPPPVHWSCAEAALLPVSLLC